MFTGDITASNAGTVSISEFEDDSFVHGKMLDTKEGSITIHSIGNNFSIYPSNSDDTILIQAYK